MILKDYKIENNGIWISRRELECWYEFYCELYESLSNLVEMSYSDATELFKCKGQKDTVEDILSVFNSSEHVYPCINKGICENPNINYTNCKKYEKVFSNPITYN